MADDISTKIILDHIQAMNGSLQGQMQAMNTNLQRQITDLSNEMKGMKVEMRHGFEAARLHRQALQEDLEATILIVGKHNRKLARI